MRAIYGVIHLSPLPGTPYYEPGSFERTLNTAVESARALQRGGAHGCLVQTCDRVYRSDDSSDLARTVAAGLVVRAIRADTSPDFLVGVQLMRNAIKASFAVAHVAGGQFVRVTALAGSIPADHGMLESDPYEAMAYRRFLGANNVQIIADIATIHNRPSLPVGELARQVRRIGATAVALGDGDETRTTGWIAAVRAATPELSVVLAGHTNHDNAHRLLRQVDGAFVGTCLESSGWGSVIDEGRVTAYMGIVRDLPPREDLRDG